MGARSSDGAAVAHILLFREGSLADSTQRSLHEQTVYLITPEGEIEPFQDGEDEDGAEEATTPEPAAARSGDE